MGLGHAVPLREQILFSSENAGKGQPFPNPLDTARCRQPLWPPPHWPQGLPWDITAPSETRLVPVPPVSLGLEWVWLQDTLLVLLALS